MLQDTKEKRSLGRPPVRWSLLAAGMAVLVAGGCSSVSRASSPSSSAHAVPKSSGSPATTQPTAPLGTASQAGTSTTATTTTARARAVRLPDPSGPWLAIADNAGVLLWSRAGGVVRVSGLPTTATVYADLTWSADGRYLGWYECQRQNTVFDYEPVRSEAIAGCPEKLRLVMLDTARGTTTTWESGTIFGPMVVTAAGVYVPAVVTGARHLFSELVHYLPDGAKVTVPIAGASRNTVNVISATASAFVAWDWSNPTFRLFTVALDGSVTFVGRVPDVGAGGWTAERFAASPDGTALAIEYGSQTEGNGTQRCSLAGGVRLGTVDLRTGSVRQFTLPAGPLGQIGSMSFGQDGALDLSEYACSDSSPPGTPVEPPVLLQLGQDGLTAVASGAIAGERSSVGSLAVMEGSYRLVRGAMPPTEVVTAPGVPSIEVDGTPVSGLGATVTDIAWSPARPQSGR